MEERMFQRDPNTWMIQSALLIAREESLRPFADQRTQTYLDTRIGQLHKALDRRSHIPRETLSSAYHLVANLATAYEEAYDSEDKSAALYRAVLRDLRDELEAAVKQAAQRERTCPFFGDDESDSSPPESDEEP